ncbi:hypothetical protein K435DRAFT_942680 [Dendrothele bispora CBS 962.96]|uniref:Major facilitator superfamily (MFS) profile domain-containing protein n=1 Tax=Dendrothele bispora (strain CBS 962.96) TaxID=1314807 RepID=A0A4S8M9Y9_DENBC|nr:hypothetical protein K435DRAFT_942680 [Dendrothele bispora CBS 962.96]
MFIAGFSGSAPIVIGGGSVSDLFSAKDQASAMAIYGLGPLIGPAVGPVAGGFIAQSIGEKYVFVIIGALGTVSMVIGVPLLQETYAPIIRQRRALADGDLEKAKNLRGPMGNTSRSQYILAHLIRPPMLLFGSKQNLHVLIITSNE